MAQSALSTVRGTVTDPSEAVVPGVEIVLTEVATNVPARSVITGQNGEYEIPDLKPGIYRLKAELPGFKSFIADDITLEGGQTRRVDIRLQVGETSETVTVRAGTAVITTDSGAISTGFDKKQFADTPVIDVYPSPLGMLTTLPGIQGAGWEITVSGQNRSQLSQAMDGIDNDRTGEQTNNMNFFEEVTVVTVNNAADHSRVANYNMTSKRGDNEFHGTVYYKHFNSGLNARFFFEPRKTPFIQHEWQIEASGPIIKNKTFYYASWVGQRIPLGFFKRASVPTLKMRQGDFSQFTRAIVDPLTGQPFPGKTIPSNRMNSVATRAQELFIPQPNLGGPEEFTNNFGFTHPFHYDFYKGDWPFVRLDHNLTDKNSIYGRWIERRTPYVLDSGLPKFIWTRLRNHQQTVISDTHLFSPTVVNTFRFGWNRNYIVDGNETAGVKPLNGAEAVQAIGLQGVNRGGHSAQGFPRMNITGLTTLSTVAGGVRNDDNDFSYEDSVTWSAASHVWKFGGELKTFEAFDGVIPEGTFGVFTFNGSLTGVPYADFLLGLPFSSQRLDPFANRTRHNREVGLFIMDTFKVNPRLTLDYGLRWDFYDSPTYQDGLMYNWDAKTGNVIVPQSAVSRISPLYPKTITIVPGKVVPNSKLTNLRPRFAVAYRPTEKLVIRGGYGAFTERIDYFARVQGGGPFQLSETYFNSVRDEQALFAFPNPFPSSLAAAQIPSQSISGFPLDTDNGVIHQFNLTVEREIADIGFRVSYVGSRSRGLNYNLNINKPPPSETQFSQSRRPYPQFINATVALTNGASNYDSLQVQAQRRVGAVIFNAHWTWLSNMANFLNTENPYNVTEQWARIARDRRHYAVISTTFELPWGRGRRYLANAPAAVDQIIGGWKLQTISYFATGEYFSPGFSGSDPSNTNTFGGLPDRVTDGNLPPSQRTKERWFDPSAFVVPPKGRFGNSGVNILEGQGLNVHHMSMAKRFRLNERFSMTYTASISDLFNRPHFNNPLSNISVPGAGRFVSVVPDYAPEKHSNRRIMMKLRVEW